MYFALKLEIEMKKKSYSSQCAPSFYNMKEKFHGLFHFFYVFMYETIQNQLKKIQLPLHETPVWAIYEVKLYFS